MGRVVYRGHRGVVRSFVELSEGFEDFGFEVERLIDAGNRVVALGKMYGQGRVFYGSFAHDAKTWDNPDIYHMYFEAIKWALKLTDADATPRPLPGTATTQAR